MYKCVIIDDEPHAIEGLKKYIEKIQQLTISDTYTDPVEALSQVNKGDKVDLIFMDIDMPEISGIELAKVIRNKTSKLIFTTAHTKYGYDAFEVKADGYLLKPYSLTKFITTVEGVMNLGGGTLADKELKRRDDFFFVKSKEENLKLVKVRYDEIIAVESKLNYVMIHTLHKNVLTYMSLTEISTKLKGREEFQQFQRSFIIAQRFIETIDGNTIAMQRGIKLTVGDYYRKDFNDFVNSHLLKARRK